MTKKSKSELTELWEGLMFQLQDLGVHKILVEYSGGGDSGQIDTTSFCDKDGDNINKKLKDKSDLLKVVDDYCYDALLNDIEDWCNNDGGQGTIEIQIPSGEYKIENHVNYTESTLHKHSGKVGDPD